MLKRAINPKNLVIAFTVSPSIQGNISMFCLVNMTVQVQSGPKFQYLPLSPRGHHVDKTVEKGSVLVTQAKKLRTIND
jgi:hypothetical protein